MKYFFYFFHIATFYVLIVRTIENKDTSKETTPTNLTSVFNSCCLTSLYKAARKQAPRLESAPKSDALTNDAICESVMSSHYFSANSYAPVNVEEIYVELEHDKNMYEHVLRDLFEKTSNEKVKEIFAIDNTYLYTNPYHKVNEEVIIREGDQSEFQVDSEYVFTCVARDCVKGGLEAFYVTREYNTVDEASGRHIAGRFVFRGDRQKELTLIALAEQPAEILYGKWEDQAALERYYLKVRKNEPADKWEDEDAFCGLIDRTRLCASIFAGMSSTSEYYADEFATKTYYRPTKCFPKEVSFLTDEAKKEKGDQKYYELMVYCEAWENYEDADVMVRYFVSRAYKPGQVFVYSVTDEENPDCLSGGVAYLENLSINLGVSVY